MARRAGLWIAALVVVSLAIGVFWTIRTAPPSPAPWWWGKNPDFHVEVWEPGKEMATVAMPISRHAAMMRTAISPRLAIRIFLNIRGWTRSVALILPVGAASAHAANHPRL